MYNSFNSLSARVQVICPLWLAVDWNPELVRRKIYCSIYIVQLTLSYKCIYPTVEFLTNVVPLTTHQENEFREYDFDQSAGNLGVLVCRIN